MVTMITAEEARQIAEGHDVCFKKQFEETIKEISSDIAKAAADGQMECYITPKAEVANEVVEFLMQNGYGIESRRYDIAESYGRFTYLVIWAKDLTRDDVIKKAIQELRKEEGESS